MTSAVLYVKTVSQSPTSSTYLVLVLYEEVAESSGFQRTKTDLPLDTTIELNIGPQKRSDNSYYTTFYSQHSATMASASVESGGCASPKCDNIVTKRLACPKCVQLGLPPTYFCSQTCFKENYKTHKSIHSLAKQIMAASG